MRILNLFKRKPHDPLKEAEERGYVVLTKEAWKMNERFLEICQQDRDKLIELLKKRNEKEAIMNQSYK